MTDKPDFCPFFPDDPRCIDPVEEAPEVAPVVDISYNQIDLTTYRPLEGQIVFTAIAFSQTFWTGINLFYYKGSTGYYNDGVLMSRNYWQIANVTQGLVSLAITIAMSVFQVYSLQGENS